MIRVSICLKCKHFNREKAKAEKVNTCAAFPDKISHDVWFGKLDHRLPIEGDNGIQFEADPEWMGK